jgi:Glycosyl transferase family 2
MPAYNERPTVERALERVLETEFPVADVELVVVDDRSTDGTGELLTGPGGGKEADVARRPARTLDPAALPPPERAV